MQDSRPQSSAGSHRPATISNNLSTLAVVIGVGFMAVDTFCTVKKGLGVFNSGDFLVNIIVALLWAGFCAVVQKAVFSVFVDTQSKNIFDGMWRAGTLGKLALFILTCVGIAAIHFSFSSTSQTLGINASRLGISLPGQESTASLGMIIQFLIGAFVGVMVAFIDEICFLCARIIKGHG